MATADTTRTTTFRFTDADAIEQFFSAVYTSMQIRSNDHPALRYRATGTDALTLDTIAQTSRLDLQAEPLHKIVVTRLSTARIRVTGPGEDRWFTAGSLFLAAYPDRPYAAHLLPGEVHDCILEPALLSRVAATAPGRRPQALRFTGLNPLSPTAAAHWWDTRRHVADLLTRPEAAASPLLLSTAAQLLAAATLTTFPNTAVTDPTIEDRHDATPLTLRRSITFIDEHATADISVADIAAAAHVSIRAVQLAFRRHLGCTPTTYLRQARLDHAHHHLINADPARTTVAAVAARYGFTDYSRFTATYRATYGVVPSSTLRDMTA